MIWSIQALRFVAALMIVYVHALQSAIAVTGSGGVVPYDMARVAMAGVDIFFVISGFIIATIAPGRGPVEFAVWRICRVVPLYLICSAIPFAISLFQGEMTWRGVLATALLWPATDVMTKPALGVGWTLCFEMLFYMAAALVLLHRRWLYGLLALYALVFTLRAHGPVFQFLGNPIIVEFLFGVAIAKLPRAAWGRWCAPLGLAALVVVGLTGYAPGGNTLRFLAGDDALLRVLVFGLPAALIVYGCLHITIAEGRLTYLGETSYSLYLTNIFPTGLMLVFLQFPVRPEIIILCGMAFSVVFAWRFYERVERPLLRRLRALTNRRLAPRAATQTA